MSEGERRHRVDREALVELAKRRGFFFQTSEPYGGVAGFYTFGPQGAALKHNLEAAWRERFTVAMNNDEIEAPTVMPEAVFEASGHLDTFDDVLVECPACGASHRADHLVEDHADVEEAEALPIDEIEELVHENDIGCPDCGTSLAGEPVEEFNLMFRTNIGPGDADPGYLRPETAQGIFADFSRLAEYARNQLPFGVTQIGPAYRNEISPRGGLLRLRELHQAELEQFIDPGRDEPPLGEVEDLVLPLYSAERQQNGTVPGELTVRDAVEAGIVTEPWIAYFLGVAKRWYERVGVDMDRFRFRQHASEELSHYASDCWDAETEVHGDWIEAAGFAYRGDYDLRKHDEYADDEFTVFRQYDEPVTVERPTLDPDMSYLGPAFGGRAQQVVDALEDLARRDPEAFEDEAVAVRVDGDDVTVPVEATGFSVEAVTEHGEHVTPHVVEPSFGVDRLVYSLLAHAHREDEVDGEARTYLALDPEVAPTFVGVFPLVDDQESRARELADELRERGLAAEYDDSGSIGRRYRRQDEVGTPFCVTLDERTSDDDTVTVRERDSTGQVRVALDELPDALAAVRDGEASFADL